MIRGEYGGALGPSHDPAGHSAAVDLPLSGGIEGAHKEKPRTGRAGLGKRKNTQARVFPLSHFPSARIRLWNATRARSLALSTMGNGALRAELTRYGHVPITRPAILPGR
jgi:hypothetical protein